ncbi:MAG: C40 family peptidase [Actinobacteria bacterium]|nr:C40 family peptidase [Actinomycetota bacterium]MCG2818510.1 NlpC/P60 family protein [Actinomycetes bacterium]MBU4218301.1 C40 family peptidase [Actinomycetota bacterium]MBU4358726.1 C40 family peptidase [Actinomycetota bacterium]MBU4391894.1 C40 family peptidase [Actinomycetota bacterium]
MLVAMMSPWVAAQPLDQQKADAQKDVESIQQKLEDAVERYNYACSKIEQTRNEIEQNEAALTAAEAELAKNKDRLNSRVRAMYMTRHNRFLDVVVNAGNFDEFLVGMDLAKKLSGKDAKLVRDVKDAKANLEAARNSLEERKNEQEAARKDLAASKKAIETDLSGAKGKLSGVEEEIKQAMEARLAEASSSSSSSNWTSNPTNPTTPSKPPGAPNGGVVGVAYDQLGKPYVWGGAGPNSFDCSGLVQYCYRVGAGKYIPHSSYAQRSCGSSVSVSQMAPGDIVGFRGWGHVGIYAGGGSYIHAPHSGDVVRVASLSARRNYCGAVRP